MRDPPNIINPAPEEPRDTGSDGTPEKKEAAGSKTLDLLITASTHIFDDPSCLLHNFFVMSSFIPTIFPTTFRR